MSDMADRWYGTGTKESPDYGDRVDGTKREKVSSARSNVLMARFQLSCRLGSMSMGRKS